MIEHPSTENDKLAHWRKTEFDRRGLPVAVKDFTGLDVSMAYGPSGTLTSTARKSPEGNVIESCNIERDASDRILAVKSSSGETSFDYTAEGDLKRIEIRRGKESSAANLSGGLLRKVVGFDGGVTTFDYQQIGDAVGALSGVICANGLKLAREYDAAHRIAAVQVGAERRVRIEYDTEGRVSAFIVEPRPGRDPRASKPRATP